MILLSFIPLLLLSYLFITAATQKFNHRPYTKETIENYRIIPQSLSAMTVVILMMTEFTTGIFLLIPGFQNLSLFAASMLLLAYTFAIGINLARGRTHLDCGCNGPANRQKISKILLLRNGFLLLVVALLLTLNIVVPASVVSWLIALLASGFCVLVYEALRQLKANRDHMRRESTV